MVTKTNRITIKDVAKAAGVVPSTVSQALNNKGYVEAKTRQRILDTAQALGYHPDARARGLRTGEAKIIGLFSAMPFQIAAGPARLGFLMEITSVAAQAAVEKNLALLILPSTAQGAKLDTFSIDGALILEPTANDPYVAQMLKRNIPTVCLGKYPGKENLPFIDLHSSYTADLLFLHLKDSGCKHIALLVGDSDRNSYKEAITQYRAFCSWHGMKPLVRRIEESGGEDSAYVNTVLLLEENPEVDGICALVDTFASAAMKAALACNKTVPEQLKIVTRYDGIRAKTATPPITAVDLHLDAVASLGVELLFRHINGEPALSRLTPPLPDLVIRKSSILL